MFKYLFLLLFLNSYCQEKLYLIQDVILDNGVYISTKVLSLENGDGKIVDVKSDLKLPDSILRKISLYRLNELIKTSSQKTMNQGINKYSYDPKEVKIYHKQTSNAEPRKDEFDTPTTTFTDTIFIRIEAVFENEVGGKVVARCACTFNDKGEFIDVICF